MALARIGGDLFSTQNIVKFKYSDEHNWQLATNTTPIDIIENAYLVQIASGFIYDKSTDNWTDILDTTKEAMDIDTKEVPFKYDEKRLLEEFNTYVASTYGKHYVGEDNIQSLDLIFATGHGEGFCIGNVLKYGARCGKKKGQERDDLLKTMHYAMLGLYQLDKKAKKNAKV